jgi:hypothetical protein
LTSLTGHRSLFWCKSGQKSNISLLKFSDLRADPRTC